MKSLTSIRRFSLGLLALLLAFWGQARLHENFLFDAILLYAAAIVLFVALFRRQALPHAATTRLLTEGRRLGWRWAPLALALVVGVIAFENFDVDALRASSWWQHFASIALLLLAAVVLDWGRPRAEQDEPWRRGQVLAFVAIFGLALITRLFRFDSLPFGVWYDEAEAGLQALRILEDPNYRPFFVDSINVTAHYLHLVALAFEWFGVSVQSIRAVSVVMGLATVVAGYLAGKELYDRQMGLVMALLMAVARWNVNFSRIGMYNLSAPLFELLTIAFLLRGIRTGRFTDYALAGLWIGLGLSFYPAYQLFLGVLALFLLAKWIAAASFVRSVWPGLLAMSLAAAVTVMPVARYVYAHSDTYLVRTRKTSIFTANSASAELPAIAESVRKHLLMFNYRGDPNGRHNLPGEPMLDPYMAGLMVLGLALCLWWIKRPRAFLLPAWLAITLLGGILTLNFEAPQSLRSIGAMPAAYLMAIAPLYVLNQEWRRSGGRYYRSFATWLMVGFLALVTFSNAHTYFVRQANDFAVWNAFSTPVTIAARLLNEMGDQANAYVISLYHGHPTLRFLARDVPTPQRLETQDRLPLQDGTGGDIVLIMDTERRALFEEARRLYPNATFQEFSPPFGGPTVVYYVYLGQGDIASVQGLMGAYYRGEEWQAPAVRVQQDEQLAFDWTANPPLDEPFSVEWRGVLAVPTYGPHQFFLQAPNHAELYIGEELILEGRGETRGGVVLAQGNHALRVRALGGNGSFSLGWRPPDRAPELIPASSLYVPPVSSNGLLGRYFANGNWTPPETFAQIDPRLNTYFHITPLPRPYTVEWSGKIAIPESGLYTFGLQSIDESTLLIDDQEIVSSRERNAYTEGSIDLEAGLHDILIRYADRTDHTYINLTWTLPNGQRQIVPSEALFPPQASYEFIEMPKLGQFTFEPGSPTPPTVGGDLLGGEASVVRSELAQPKGLAVGADGRVYVADTGNRRVLLLDSEGQIRAHITGGQAPFIAPFDVAVDADGQVYALDSGDGEEAAGRISVFDPEGQHLFDVPADTTYLDRARGLFVDETGRIWIANTPGGTIVALDVDGELLLEFPVWVGEEGQPTDVVVGANGDIFVADAGLFKLIRFSPEGRRLLAWDIPVANSVDGPHLAVDRAGAIYLTGPEKWQITKLAADGELVGTWTLQDKLGSGVKPVGVAVDKEGRIWVSDSGGGKVVLLEPVQ